MSGKAVKRERYYLSSFFWSTLTKVLNAAVGFISVPLLMGLFGRAEYGILTLAMSCNAYMHLLDLGTNNGAVRFFSGWRAEGKGDMISKVAHTNITFYGIVALINAAVMVLLAFCGESLFSISHSQFMILRWCLLSIAVLSVFSWGASTFSQLLISDMQMAFTQKMQFVQVLLKIVLIVITLKAPLSLQWYFFLLTLLTASLIIPYAIKCRRDRLIDNFKPGFWWPEFKVVLVFSLSLFALSFFQVTATESRPIVLGICIPDSANTLTDFKIISVVPSLIITIGGAFSSIFIPSTSEMVARGEQDRIERFAYKWTRYTSVIANVLCVPFILCASEMLSAYVGEENAHLGIWMILWCITVLVQIHTTPGNSLVIAYGKTRALVITTAAACLLSIVLNVLLCRHFGVGSAVIAYFIYVLIVIGSYYLVYYRKLMGLSRSRMAFSFLAPTLTAFAVMAICMLVVKISPESFGGMNRRLAFILICLVKTACWIIPYGLILLATRQVRLSEFKELKPVKQQ